MPDDIDALKKRQAARRRRVNMDVAIAVFWQAFTVGILLWVRTRCFAEGSFWGAILLILAIADAALIIPILMVRNERMKEIAGGEEDEARKY